MLEHRPSPFLTEPVFLTDAWRLGSFSGLWGRQCPKQQICQSFTNVLAVAVLVAVAIAMQHQHAVLRHTAAREEPQALLYRLRKCRGECHVEPKLDRARNLVDILPARSG